MNNNKGVTLIESIVTIAIIAIVLGAMAVGFTSIIHYMSESSLIKSTSNEIFTKVQNDEGDHSTSTMNFTNSSGQQIEVEGKTKTVTQSYNDKDSLSLSVFSSGTPQKQYNESANFYLLINPYDKGKEGNEMFDNTSTFIVNDNGKMTPNKDCVQNGTKSSIDVDYITSHVKYPDKSNTVVEMNILMILQDSSYYKDVSMEDVSIEWFHVIKNDDSPYSVYGIVKPYHKDVEEITVEFIFYNEKNPTPEPVYVTINSKEGFNEKIIELIHDNLNIPGNSDGKNWQSDDLFGGNKFKISGLLGDLSIFDNLQDKQKVEVYYK